MRLVFKGTLVVGLFMAGAGVCGTFAFGSLCAALDYLCGDRILVVERHKALGKLKAGKDYTISYNVRNVSGEVVTINGATASCGCIGVIDLPLTLEKGDSAVINVYLHARDKPAPMEGQLVFHTDFTNQPVLTVSYSAMVGD